MNRKASLMFGAGALAIATGLTACSDKNDANEMNVEDNMQMVPDNTVDTNVDANTACAENVRCVPTENQQ